MYCFNEGSVLARSVARVVYIGFPAEGACVVCRLFHFNNTPNAHKMTAARGHSHDKAGHVLCAYVACLDIKFERCCQRPREHGVPSILP